MTLESTLYDIFQIEGRYTDYPHTSAKKGAQFLISERDYHIDSFWITKPDFEAMIDHLDSKFTSTNNSVPFS